MDSSMAGMSSITKPQFGPWLIEQVQGGQYEGLHMTGPDTFRIPWKHNSRKDCGDEDNKIFREWAVVSGKINDYPNDKAKWKTNFRCALRSLKQFEMVHDNSKSEDPHKIYRIIRDNLQECQNIYIQDINILPEIMEHEDLLNNLGTLHLNPPPEIQRWEAYQQPMENLGNYLMNPLSGAILQPDLHSNIPAQQHYNIQAQQHYNTVAQAPFESLPSPYELEISFHYRRTEMWTDRHMGQFVQLHYHCDQSELRGVSVPFPSTEKLIDHKQVQYTKRILDNIQRGLLLEVCPTGIYGFRQDKCNVFVSTSNPAEIQNPEPKKLIQNCRELLFSFEKFNKDLRDFTENLRGSPDYTIYLCFGEKFPDGKPVEKKLIVVKVVPLICRELHKRAQMDGASSLQNDNISLQISNSLFDLIESTFFPPTAD